MTGSLEQAPETNGATSSAQVNGSLPEGIYPEIVRECLERALASATFRPATAQRKFLRYTVEQTLAGHGHLIKEYTVGIDVFGRGESYDPRVDNIVRGEARKLRARLEKYYANEGRPDPVLFHFPKGSYAPTFSLARPESFPHAAGPAASKVVTTEESSRADVSSLSGEHSSTGYRWILAALLASGVAAVALLMWARATATPVSIPTPSVAVLPFANLSDNRQDDSFSDGLTEDLIDSLVRIPGLHVVARTSSFRFKDSRPDLREIGRALRVHTVLNGTVRQYGTRLRVSAKLEDTDTGYTIWSKTLDRQLSDVLALQTEISASIVQSLGPSFKPDTGGTAKAAHTPTVNPAAYQAWLKGVYFYNKHTGPSLETAVGYFKDATQKDPNFAQGWLGLARCYAAVGVVTASLPARDAIPKVRAAANKALALDPSLGAAHLALGAAYTAEMEWTRAEEELHAALGLNPGDAAAHRSYGIYLVRIGRLNDALNENQIAFDLDPLSSNNEAGVARNLYDLGRYDESIPRFREALSINPENGGASQGLAMVLLAAHRYDEAIAEAEKARMLMGGDAMVTSDVGYAYGIAGKEQQARAILDQLRHWSATGFVRALPIAHVYMGLGDKDHAFEWLNRALDQQDANIYLKSDPRYQPLRSDPRFAALLRRAKLSL